MNTPKTPMERASKWCRDNDYIRKTVTIEGEWTEPLPGCEKAYLAGDAEREAIEKEKREVAANAMRENLIARCKEELAAKDRRIALLEKETTRLFEPTKEFWNQEALQTALADRQELVDCVLEMAKAADGSLCDMASRENSRRALFAIARSLKAQLDKHADLIAKLKAEKDTP